MGPNNCQTLHEYDHITLKYIERHKEDVFTPDVSVSDETVINGTATGVSLKCNYPLYSTSGAINVKIRQLDPATGDVMHYIDDARIRVFEKVKLDEDKTMLHNYGEHWTSYTFHNDTLRINAIVPEEDYGLLMIYFHKNDPKDLVEIQLSEGTGSSETGTLSEGLNIIELHAGFNGEIIFAALRTDDDEIINNSTIIIGDLDLVNLNHKLNPLIAADTDNVLFDKIENECMRLMEISSDR